MANNFIIDMLRKCDKLWKLITSDCYQEADAIRVQKDKNPT
jgi:hypothetical protein